MSKKPKFKLRHGDDPAKIVMWFFYKTNRVIVSTGVSIERRFWDSKNNRARRSKEYPQAAKVNAMLDRMSALINEAWIEYRAKGVTPAPDALKAAFLAKWDKREDKGLSVQGHISAIIEKHEGKTTATRLTPYRNLQKHLVAYEAKHKTVVLFADISEQFKDDFLTFLNEQRKADGELLADGYIKKLITTLRAVAKDAYRLELIDDDPTAKVRLSAPARAAVAVYLNDAELRALFNLEGLGERLSRARDLFLLGCFTGLRYSDYNRVRPENIRTIGHGDSEQECLVITSQKTKTKTVLPIANPMLKAILERHGNSAAPTISSQQLNKAIKELCKLAGFTQQIEHREYRAGEEVVSVVEKWELVSTHTARRSFATNAYKAGMAAAEIMRFTGHTTESAFLKYIKVGEEEAAVKLAGHRFFTGASPLRKAE